MAAHLQKIIMERIFIRGTYAPEKVIKAAA